jgi:CDP-6-deoxy-D-xylo-4-hexulose-3-dehydrase
VNKKYQLASNTWDELEEKAIARVIKSGQYTMGKEVSKFEDEFACFVGVKHAIMVNSGSSANLIACAAFKYSNRFNLGTVIVPAVSWSTTFFPLSQMGYKLKFIDIDLLTLNIDVSKIEECITEEVVGICGVSLLGNPTGMDAIRDICNNNKLFFYEDNCESLGASIKSKLAGSFGHISTHSFFFSHHLQTMEGGMLCTNDDEYAKLARSLRAHGWTRDKKSGDLSDVSIDPFHKSFEFILPGYCVRPIEFMGAIGQEQLKKWPEMKKMRRKNAEKFKTIIEKYPSYLILQNCFENESSWFGFSMILTGTAIGKRAVLIDIFNKLNIEYRPIVAGNFTRQSVIKLLKHEQLTNYPAADQVHDNGIFVGNDSRDLIEELKLLETALTEFILKLKDD